MEADIVVIGSGAGGLTAAVVAARQGLKVVLLEATATFGGTTAISGGGVWIPANRHMPELGFDDSPDLARTYLKAVVGNYYNGVKIDAFLEQGPRMLEYLEDNTELQLAASNVPDYAPDQPGWNQGRCLLTASYDAGRLGNGLFARLRRPLPEFGLFGSMQITPAEGYMMARWKTSRAFALLALRRLGGYAWDRIRGKRGQVLCNGNALAAQLLKSAADAGVVLLAEHRATGLLREAGAVIGVTADHDGKALTFTGRRGVILASGGFGADEAMRRELIPQADAGWSLQPEGSRGDGIRMGEAAGGLLNRGNAANAIYAPASAFPRADGSMALFPSLFFDRHCPGSIMVDARTGERFVDESFHYQNFGETAAAKGVTRIWQIADVAAVRTYGLGLIKPAPFPIGPWVGRGYAKEAATIPELATQLGLDPAKLENTVTRFNQFADTGIDEDFHRGENAYSSYMGDASHQPNPALGALRQGPFYAIEVRPSQLSTLAGLNTNEHAQVIDAAGAPIPGLYAVGVDSNSLMGGRYPGGGSSLGPAMTFGYIAALHLAGREAPAR